MNIYLGVYKQGFLSECVGFFCQRFFGFKFSAKLWAVWTEALIWWRKLSYLFLFVSDASPSQYQSPNYGQNEILLIKLEALSENRESYGLFEVFQEREKSKIAAQVEI